MGRSLGRRNTLHLHTFLSHAPIHSPAHPPPKIHTHTHTHNSCWRSCRRRNRTLKLSRAMPACWSRGLWSKLRTSLSPSFNSKRHKPPLDMQTHSLAEGKSLEEWNVLWNVLQVTAVHQTVREMVTLYYQTYHSLVICIYLHYPILPVST